MYSTLPAVCRALAKSVEPHSNEKYTYHILAVVGVTFALNGQDDEAIQCFEKCVCPLDASAMELHVAKTLRVHINAGIISPDELLRTKIAPWITKNNDMVTTNVKTFMTSLQKAIAAGSNSHFNIEARRHTIEVLNKLHDSIIPVPTTALSEEVHDSMAQTVVDFVHTINACFTCIAETTSTKPRFRVSFETLTSSEDSAASTTSEDSVTSALSEDPDGGGGGGGGGNGQDAPVSIQLPNALYNRVNVMVHLDAPEVQVALSKYLESVDAMLQDTMANPDAREFVRTARDEFFTSVLASSEDKGEGKANPSLSERDRVLAEMRKGGCTVSRIDSKFRGDREIVLAVVQQNGYALKDASEELRGDREIVMVAIRQTGRALQYASDELRGDREIVMAAIHQTGRALRYAPEELRGDREIVMAAIHQNGFALRYAPEELRGDREIILAAVQNYGWALQYASEELKGDREIVLAAVQNYGWALQCASEELRGDREIVLAAVQNDGWALRYASDELQAKLR